MAAFYRNGFYGNGFFSNGFKERSMQNKPKSERSDDRPTEDDNARAALGGTRGAAELPPAELSKERGKKLPLERDDDPGHTA